MKKIVSFLLALMLALSLAACSAKSASSDSASMASDSYDFNGAELPDAKYDDTASDDGAWNGQEVSSAGADLAERGVKMVYTASIEMQTLEFDQAAQDIASLVESMGGYFEQKNFSNYSSSYRHASYTVRVPAEQFTDFCTQVGTLCHVTWQSDTAENISERYYDTQSRLETAQIKLERLQELLDIPANRKVIEFSQISRDGEGQPVAYDVKFVPYARAYPSVESEIRYAVLPDLTFAKLSSFSVYSQITVTAVAAEGEPARALECPEGTPLLLIEQIFLQQDGSRVGVQHHYSRAPRGKLTGTSGHRQ